MLRKILFISGFTLSMVAQAVSEMPFLARLKKIAGASGFEKLARQVMEKQWQTLLKDLTVDGIGNLIGYNSSNLKRM